jgi:Tat protein secretion system quality control protein TatD with DNase activity
MIDSHCHLDDYEDLPAILAHARDAGVGRLLAIGIGDGPDTMHRALDLAHAHPEIWATAGIHPQEAHRATAENLAKLEALVADPRCLAVGEIGLDYYHLDNPDIAHAAGGVRRADEDCGGAGKPITIHCRTSELAIPAAKAKVRAGRRVGGFARLIAEHWTPTGLPGIMHCFSGNEEIRRRARWLPGSISRLRATLRTRSRRPSRRLRRALPPTGFWSRPTRRFSRLFRCGGRRTSLRTSLIRRGLSPNFAASPPRTLGGINHIELQRAVPNVTVGFAAHLTQ